jgi:Stress responsive A/B Barrel Domain
VITHVVLFKFKAENKDANIAEAKARLEAMAGKVEVLRAIEVGVNVVPSPRAYDVSLITRFDDLAALAVYADHPVHVLVKQFLAGVLEASVVVDSSSANPA